VFVLGAAPPLVNFLSRGLATRVQWERATLAAAQRGGPAEQRTLAALLLFNALEVGAIAAVSMGDHATGLELYAAAARAVPALRDDVRVVVPPRAPHTRSLQIGVAHARAQFALGRTHEAEAELRRLLGRRGGLDSGMHILLVLLLHDTDRCAPQSTSPCI
jgi:hypothetical protein